MKNKPSIYKGNGVYHGLLVYLGNVASSIYNGITKKVWEYGPLKTSDEDTIVFSDDGTTVNAQFAEWHTEVI